MTTDKPPTMAEFEMLLDEMTFSPDSETQRLNAEMRALFARAIERPSREWLARMGDAESGCQVTAGGLAADLGLLNPERPAVDVGAFEAALDGFAVACSEGLDAETERLGLQLRDHLTAAIEARDRAEADAKKLRDDYALEVDQFNEGYEVARKWIGEMPTDPRSAEPGWRDQDKPCMDTFGGGFAWGGYEKVIAERDAAIEARDREKQRADRMAVELRELARVGDTLSPQEIINHCANGLGVDRHTYYGEPRLANRSVIDLDIECRTLRTELAALREDNERLRLLLMDTARWAHVVGVPIGTGLGGGVASMTPQAACSDIAHWHECPGCQALAALAPSQPDASGEKA